MMSTVIGGAMLPHAPQFFTMPDTEDEALVAHVREVAADVGKRLRALEPDLWIIFSNDHAEQFFHTTAPPFTVHVGGEATGESLRAFAKSIELGVSTLELDINVTKGHCHLRITARGPAAAHRPIVPAPPPPAPWARCTARAWCTRRRWPRRRIDVVRCATTDLTASRHRSGSGRY